MNTTKKLSITFLIFFALFSSANVLAQALVREALETTTEKISKPHVPVDRNFWIFTAPDENNVKQVYYQYLDSATGATDPSPKVQLTFNSVDAENAKFGNETVSNTVLEYAETASSTPVECEGILFFYIADVDQNNIDELRMGCLKASSFETQTPDILFDIRMTGYDAATDFDVADYDVSRQNFTTTVIYYPGPSMALSFPVVFTDKSNDLHMLMFRGDLIYGDSTNITALEPSIVYDYTDNNGVYTWDSATINKNKDISSPRLDPWGNNVLYAVKESNSSYKQLGTVSITGSGQYILTDLNSDVLNPQFHHNFYRKSNQTAREGYHVFFETKDPTSGNQRLMYLRFYHWIFGARQWCNTAAYLTENATDYLNLKTSYGSSTSTDPSTLMVFEKIHPDNNNDIYLAEYNFETSNYCDGSQMRSDGIPIQMVSPSSGVKAEALANITSDVSDKMQLTCQEHNTDPIFLADTFHDVDFNEVTSTMNHHDIVFLRQFSDGSGFTVGHLYNSEEETDECQDTCYETADGSPIIDSNGILDGDGIADSCETGACEDEIHVNFTADSDGDGHINHKDNCPCTPNPSQADSDNDGWGDECDIEANECGTMDSDGDGAFDNCDQCPNHASTAFLNYDLDSDGIMDSCVNVTSTGEPIVDPETGEPIVNDDSINETTDPDESFSIDGGFLTASGTFCSLNTSLQSNTQPLATMVMLTFLILGALSYRKREQENR